MYLPVGFQRRFSFGLHPLLGLLAGLGLWAAWTRLHSFSGGTGSLLRIAGAVLIGPALFGSTVLLYAAGFAVASEPARGVPVVQPHSASATFQPSGLRAAGLWLAARMGADDVVLAHTLSGNFLGGIVPGRVFLGHWVATLDYGSKQQEMIWFYAAPLDDERLRFLRDRRITFVVYGPHERVLGATRPDDSASRASGGVTGAAGAEPSTTVLLEPIYEVDGIAIYQVRLAGG
jgi:hypothetical protein